MSLMGNNNTGSRVVISTVDNNGRDVMGLDTVAYKYPTNRVVSGSLLTVESNHFAIVKSRGAILDMYETGQYPISTPDKLVFGSLVQGFFGGDNPFVYEVIYVQRSKLLAQNKGIATSKEMALMEYTVDYYVHVDTKEDALKLITHMPFAGETIPVKELTAYAGPVIEQAINQIVQVTPMEQVNEKIGEIIELAKEHLTEFLGVYGIALNDIKVLITPQDERMRELISLRAFGMTEQEAVRTYVALKMAEKGLVSAPNALAGQPFNIGGNTLGTVRADGVAGLPNGN